MKLFTAIILISISLFSLSSAHEGPWTAARPDGHAPISVMGDHMHEMGEWMVSYRYMSMEMEDLLSGSSSVTSNSQLGTMMMPGDFDMVPTKMTMDMHMFGTMYAISNKCPHICLIFKVETKKVFILFFNIHSQAHTKKLTKLTKKLKFLWDYKLF